MTTIKLDPGAALLLDALHGAGHAAYAVGGCVRDSLLGLDPHDWDLCTSARPEQVMALFGEEKCIPTGLQHGTVTVKQGGRLYETTTFRTEGAYSDGRHPDAICFVPDVREDLARRDFTINAMAYSAKEGLIDPFGGRDDLAAHLVRAVGEPVEPQDAQRVLLKAAFRLPHRPHEMGGKVVPPAKGVDEPLLSAVCHGVDGEIPPGKILPHIRHKADGIGVAAIGIGPLGAEGRCLIEPAARSR